MYKDIKDVIYGYMRFYDSELSIIDTLEFQRLREIKQLSLVYLVYPNALHTRFEHSLGVAYLAEVMMKYLQDKQPELNITNRLVQLVKIAGLIHDIGHVAFSHLFDIITERLNLHIDEHEVRGCNLFRHMVSKYNLDFTQEEVNFICQLVIGNNTSNHPSYLFQIISNSVNGIDVDKLDYISRDSYFTGIKIGFEYQQILRMPKVINDNICYHTKIASSIYQMFQTRYRLHDECYKHRVTIALELQVIDMILAARYELNLDSYFTPGKFKWTKLTDGCIWYKISELSKKHLAKQIYMNIKKRNIYHRVKEDGDNVIVCDRKLGFTNGVSNPVDNVLFYSNGGKIPIRINKDDVSLLLPQVFQQITKEYYLKT